MPAPVVKARANWRCHEQISTELQLFGEPKALISRSTQGCASESAVPALVVTPKATASGPLSAAMRDSAGAVSSSASSQEIRCQPGSGSPFGRVRRTGWSSRSDASISAGEARPLAHRALPVGCDGSGSIATRRPSSTTASQPQREAQSGQNAGMRRRVLSDIDTSTLLEPMVQQYSTDSRQDHAAGRLGQGRIALLSEAGSPSSASGRRQTECRVLTNEATLGGAGAAVQTPWRG